ncbi:MAG: hypothetical protein SF029_02350 [bacterium]|nr:hypothetical protein [bacterium]
MSKKHRKQWSKTASRLKDNHNWKAPKGYKIVVIERGLVSFNVPEAWFMAKMEPLELHNAHPPDDKARLTVSFWKMPSGIDWTGLPLGPLLEKSMQGSEMEVLDTSPTTPVQREDLEMVWAENLFMDPQENRPARSRVTLARGFDVHVVISFDYWDDERTIFLPVWEEVARSLQLGRVIDDPTRGPVEH